MIEKNITFSAGGKINIGDFENIDVFVSLSMRYSEEIDVDAELEEAKQKLESIKSFVKKELSSEIHAVKKSFRKDV